MRQEYSRDTERYGGSFVDVAFDLPHGLDLDQLTVQLDRMISSYQSQLQSSEAVLVAPEKRPPIVVSLDDAVKDLFVDRDRFELLLDQLDKKKNVILQGPPGVGKTFFAQRLAQVFAGGDDPNRVRLVQFHASYAYEDFVQGYSIGLLRAARKCHAAVIVGSPAALASQAVHAEVRELTASKRTIVIIELPSGPISTAVWYPLIQGLAPVRETGELAAVLAGKPSENVCNRLENAFTFWRRNRRIQGTPHGWELRCWRSQRLPARSSVSRR